MQPLALICIKAGLKFPPKKFGKISHNVDKTHEDQEIKTYIYVLAKRIYYWGSEDPRKDIRISARSFSNLCVLYRNSGIYIWNVG